MKSYKGKKVAVLGAAIEGMAVAKFLVKQGAKVTICDKKNDIEVVSKCDFDTECRLGEGYLDNLTDFEAIFRSPGVRLLLPEIQAAKHAGVEISSQIKLFFDLCPARIIGVTGTKGKGTTATLIYEILKKNIRSPQGHSPLRDDYKKARHCEGELGELAAIPSVYIAGNIGTPAIEVIGKLKPNDIVILELSSFQLQDLEKSPHIAVVLNVTQDHLDYHKDRDEYVEAKIPITKFQAPNDYAVINEDYETSRSFQKSTRAQAYGFSRKGQVKRGCFVRDGKIIWKDEDQEITIANTADLTLRGKHNWENICAAACASILAGAEPKIIGKTIAEFPGLEHRLEFVAEVGGVKYYNDSFSTTPETAIAAIKAFDEPKIIILGGSEKGSDYTELGKTVAESNVKAVCLIGEMAERIANAIQNSKFKIQNSKFKIIKGCKNMKEIIKASRSAASRGDVILLSPACASFDMFKNYKERGEQFKQEVKSLRA